MLCTKCKTDKSMEFFYANKSHKGSWCKACLLESRRAWGKANPEKLKAIKSKSAKKNRETTRRSAKKFAAAHSEKRSEYKKKWKANNPQIVAAQSRRQHAVEREELRDSYMKKVLRMADPPQELIELKRLSLQITRLLRERK